MKLGTGFIWLRMVASYPNAGQNHNINTANKPLDNVARLI